MARVYSCNVAMRYVLPRFVDDAMFAYTIARQSKPEKKYLLEAANQEQHRGRSLMSTIASLARKRLCDFQVSECRVPNLIAVAI